jgi:type II secretory pathway component PulK
MRSRKGFALMAALWLMVAIAAVSLEISTQARDRRLAAANALETQRARSAAASGVDHARARLARLIAEGGSRRTWRDSSHAQDPWFSLDTLSQFAMGDERYTVRLYDLGARLNVNATSEADLRRYFEALGLDPARAETAADGILDWIDAGDVRRVRGAERTDYVAVGARDLPRDGPVDRVDELASVRGMTPELMARVRVDFSVMGSAQVNVNTASAAVLRALPGFTASSADVIVRWRSGGQRIGDWNELLNLVPRPARASLESSGGVLMARLAYDTREVGVESIGTVDGSPVRVVIEAQLVRGGTAVFVTWSAAR